MLWHGLANAKLPLSAEHLRLQVSVHAVVVFWYIERAQDKLQASGPYLLWERQYKMVKLLVRPWTYLQPLKAVLQSGKGLPCQDGAWH